MTTKHSSSKRSSFNSRRMFLSSVLSLLAELPALAHRDAYMFGGGPPRTLATDVAGYMVFATSLAWINCWSSTLILFYKNRKKTAVIMLMIAAVFMFLIKIVILAATGPWNARITHLNTKNISEILLCGWPALLTCALVMAFNCYLVSLPARIAFAEKHRNRILILIMNIPCTLLPFAWAPLLYWSLSTKEEKPESK